MRLKRSLRATSPLLATIILIAIVVSAGVVVYGLISGWMGTFGSTLAFQPVSADLLVAGDEAMLSVSVKNTGNKPLAGIIVAGYDDNGKCFKLALPPAEPGQTSGNTLIIPLGVPNIVLDGSGYNNHGTLYGATWVNGKYGGALSFDVVDDYVEIPHNDVFNFAMNKATITAWVKPNSINRFFFVLNKGATKIHKVGFTPQNKMFFQMFTGDNFPGFDSNVEVTAGEWAFYCWVVNWNLEEGKTACSFYKNSVLDKTVIIEETSNQTNTNPVRIGLVESSPFDGVIDEVRVYNRTQDGEVAFGNANPGLPPTNGLILWLPLDEGSSAPFSFTADNRYALTITAYSLDGSVATQTLTVMCSS